MANEHRSEARNDCLGDADGILRGAECQQALVPIDRPDRDWLLVLRADPGDFPSWCPDLLLDQADYYHCRPNGDPSPGHLPDPEDYSSWFRGLQSVREGCRSGDVPGDVGPKPPRSGPK